MKKIILGVSSAFLLSCTFTGCQHTSDTGKIEQLSPKTEEDFSIPTNTPDKNSSKANNPAKADSSDTKPTDSPEESASEAADHSASLYENGQEIKFESSWQYAEFSAINSGHAIMYLAETNRKNIIIGINAGHGTKGGDAVKTLCHPDGSAKTTGGSTAAGAVQATAVSSGMTFLDGTPESSVTLAEAQILKEKLLVAGYDVLMIRNDEDVQLDNIARTVICNNIADCHIALHWDGDGLDYDKGCFFISVPDALKSMEPVASHWQEDDALGSSLVEGLRTEGCTIYQNGSMNIDLTQTSYSTIPSVDIELGNAASDHSEVTLSQLADGLLLGINSYFDIEQ